MITNLQHVLSDVVTVETASKDTAALDEEEEIVEEEEDTNTVGGFSVLGTDDLETAKPVSILGSWIPEGGSGVAEWEHLLWNAKAEFCQARIVRCECACAHGCWWVIWYF